MYYLCPPLIQMNDIYRWLCESQIHFSITPDPDYSNPAIILYSDEDYMLYLLKWGRK